VAARNRAFEQILGAFEAGATAVGGLQIVRSVRKWSAQRLCAGALRRMRSKYLLRREAILIHIGNRP
jgi:hypothetical protein